MGKRPRGSAAPVFRVADWPMAHFVQIERIHQSNAGRVLAPFGLAHREWRILALLSEHETLAINRIAEYAATERSTVSKMLDRLATKDLVTRSTDATDARARSVALTPQGRTLLRKTIPLVLALFDDYRRRMPARDYATLMRLLVEFRGHVAAAGH